MSSPQHLALYFHKLTLPHMSLEGEYQGWVTFTYSHFVAFHQGFCFLIKLTVLFFQRVKLSAISKSFLKVSERASTSE